MGITKKVEGNFDDFFEYFESEDDLLRKDIVRFLGGESYASVFCIPDVDTGGEIYFYNREILIRFTGMTLVEQKAFIMAVRKVFNEFNHHSFYLTTKKEVLRIELSENGSLNIYIQ